MCLILQDGFWFVHVPFVNMVEFQFLTQFPMDHLSHLVVFYYYYYYYYYYYFTPLRVFHTSISCWFSNGVWVTASPLTSPGLFLVFWLISTMHLVGWFPLVHPLFFCWLSLGLVVWSRLNDPFVFHHPKEFCVSHFLGQILDYAYAIYSYDQI